MPATSRKRLGGLLLAALSLSAGGCAQRSGSALSTPEPPSPFRIGIDREPAAGPCAILTVFADRLWWGQEIAEDRVAATTWFQLAACAGNVVAARCYGRSLLWGMGPGGIRADGARWLASAAERGDAEAHALLGNNLVYGTVIPRDLPAGVAHLRIAAGAGVGWAMVELADALVAHPDQARHPDEADDWYLRAIEAGEAGAAFVLAGRREATDLAAANVLLRRAAELGHEQARAMWAARAFSGQGMPADPAAAITMLERGVELDQAPSQYLLGCLLIEGNGRLPDPERALRLWSLAAEAGHAKAQVALGRVLRKGILVPADPTTAARWFTAAAKQGEIEGLVQLGDCLAAGSGVAADLPLALRCYQQAAVAGHQQATLRLVRGLLDGRGAARDPRGALAWAARLAPDKPERTLLWYEAAIAAGTWVP